MSVIELYPDVTNEQALNGWFKNTGCGFLKSSSTCSKVETKKAKDEIDIIRSEEGVNDLMYMQPEQAIRVMNRVLERLSYKQALNKNKSGKSRGKDSIRGYQDASKLFGEAIGDFMSEFRQYALGMDGELQKIGTSNKKENGFEYQSPYYKLVLPQKVKGTKPVDGVSKEELLSVLQNQKGALPGSGNIPVKNNTALYVGIGAGVLALTGGIIYMIKNKK